MQKKQYAIVSILAGLLVTLTGCAIETPFGTLICSFDKTRTSDSFRIVDDSGQSTSFDTNAINGQIDSMLDGVSLPNGASTEDLKSFVNNTTDAIGVQETVDDMQNTVNTIQDTVHSVNPESIANGQLSEDDVEKYINADENVILQQSEEIEAENSQNVEQSEDTVQSENTEQNEDAENNDTVEDTTE